MVGSQNLNAILHRPGLRRITEAGLNAYPPMFTNFFRVENSNKVYEEEAMYAGTGLPQLTPTDVEPTPQTRFAISPLVRVRHSTYRTSFVFTKKAARDDQWGLLQRAARSMGEGMRELFELLAHDLINNATTRVVGWDGQPMASNAHKLIGTSATYSNLHAAAGPSYSLLADLRQYGRKMPDDRGFTRFARLSKIVVPEEDVPIWQQYVSSNTDPTQANPNVINPYQGVQIEGDPYLTAFTAVAIYDEPRAVWFNRWGPTTDTYNIDDPPALVHRIWWEGSYMVVDARNFYFVPRV